MTEADCPMELASKRVLIVDDQPANVELLETLLEEHGFEKLEGVSDPRQVLSRCRRRRPVARRGRLSRLCW